MSYIGKEEAKKQRFQCVYKSDKDIETNEELMTTKQASDYIGAKSTYKVIKAIYNGFLPNTIEVKTPHKHKYYIITKQDLDLYIQADMRTARGTEYIKARRQTYSKVKEFLRKRLPIYKVIAMSEDRGKYICASFRAREDYIYMIKAIARKEHLTCSKLVVRALNKYILDKYGRETVLESFAKTF